MKFVLCSVFAASALLLQACAAKDPATEAQTAAAASTSDSGCSEPESGFIKPKTPGLPDIRLTGPFLVNSLMVVVDPANPNTYGSLKWNQTGVDDPKGSWLIVNDFKGPFYVGADQSLSAEEQKSPYVTVYSGCRISQ